ncbi:MAG: leucyl aminopeptidase family protein [Xanthomonadales bacterium]|nr:leucyl aminopeptidase family protein [Xanthomonadales bacterium]
MSYTTESCNEAIALIPVHATEFDGWHSGLGERQKAWVASSGFKAGAGSWCGIPDDQGRLSAVAFGTADSGWLYQLSKLPGSLPAGRYRLNSKWSTKHRVQASLGWILAGYKFDRYVRDEEERPVLCLDDDVSEAVQRLAGAQCLVRDLINTPTEDMGPGHLAAAVQSVADEFEADFEVIKGEDLLSENFPAVHAVGRAADRPPRLIRMTWGERKAPRLALVGKGVCFDTGGLDLKTATGMLLMKKDMGGAAHVLALAKLVMQYRLPVRLELLIPAVENSVSGNAYRPGDVIRTRKGLHIEIGNTDAEGRVILSDALAFACEKNPDLVVDFATLTGAARIALGPDLPPLFSNRPDVARAIEEAGEDVEDPLWTLPLYQPYREMLKSEIADLNNVGKSSFAGCITAALFLEHFIEDQVPWVHIDTFGWTPSSKPGRPVGGEALGLRAVFEFLKNRYA